MKYLILAILLNTSLLSSAQTIKDIKKQLKSTETLEQVDKLMAAFPEWQIEKVTLLESKQTDRRILNLKKGELTSISDSTGVYTYKVIEEEPIKELRVSYIYLNASEIPLSTIDSLRMKIIETYNSGVLFEDLAKQYSMDANSERGGDLGWFQEGMMVESFETAIRDHKKGDIFTVDIPANNWYYIVLKTYDQRISRSLIMVKIKSSR